MRLIKTPKGELFWVYNHDGIGREVEEKGVWEGHIYKYFGPEESVGWGKQAYCLEVGANIGVHTRELIQRYWAGVIAVEPLTAMALRANTIHLPRVEVHEVAGYSHRTILSQVDLALLTVHPYAMADADLIEALPLDLVVGLRWIDFIKIDAQGCDYAVLQGLEETVRRCRPFILSEYEPDLAKLHGVTPEIYRRWFAEHDYLEGPVDGDRVNSWGVPRERLAEAEEAGCGVNL